MIGIRFRSFRLIVNVSMSEQDGIRHPAPIGTFPLSYNGDILIKFRHYYGMSIALQAIQVHP
jgi:hypothetical protein